MEKTTRVNLHCHSNVSDGVLPPEEVAEKIAAAGVQFAALTDHDSTDGLDRFHDVLKRNNVGFVTGVEISASYNRREIHLLGYGVDVHDEEFQSTLGHLCYKKASRQQGSPMVSLPARKPEEQPAPGVAETGRIDIADAIELVHKVGGRAFLAHPLVYEPSEKPLIRFLKELKEMGLDGMEVTGVTFPASLQQNLVDIAEKLDLAVCAGTDFHGGNGGGESSLAIDMPSSQWQKFVDCVSSTPETTSFEGQDKSKELLEHKEERTKSIWSYFRARIILPSLLAITLFITAIWTVILPAVEESLIDRKRETIQELTTTVLSLLEETERQEREGILTREEAQEKAKLYIGALRYGKDGKDYFWIHDMHPKMLMHPYRPDLNGKDMSDYADPSGNKLFLEFVKLVRTRDKGFIEYFWQWNDDPDVLVAKESYISGFAPWEWVIGTGMYVDDVRLEIRSIERKIAYSLLAIAALVFVVLLYNIRQSMDVERKRADLADSLREAGKRYRSLIEATTEGTLLVVGGRCRYANPIMQQMTGFGEGRLELLKISNLFPRQEENETLWDFIEHLSGGQEGTGSFEAIMVRADGEKRDCIVTLNPVTYADQQGIIVSVRDVYPFGINEDSAQKLGRVAQAAAVGILQMKISSDGKIIAMNQAARSLMESVGISVESTPSLADLCDDPRETKTILENIREKGKVEEYILPKGDDTGNVRMLSLSATLVEGEAGEPSTISCILKDVTDSVEEEKEREDLFEKLGISLLFLQEPVGKLGQKAAVCHMDTPLNKAADLMVVKDTSCILVETKDGDPIGFVTDHDFRKRVVSNKGADLSMPVRTIMSAPLVTIPEKAMIYEALMLMEERRIQHLPVQDADGNIESIVHAIDLLQFNRFGPVVVLQEIEKASSVHQVQASCSRLPSLVGAMVDAGTRPRIVCEMISAVCDAATVRFIELAIEELGPPPAVFCFISMGSQGRREQTLLTDQDNGIIYELEEGMEPEIIADYFLSMGERVSEWLDGAGFKLCIGDVMASNPKWCQPLSGWRENFDKWIEKAEPWELLNFCICLDFRSVFGEVQLLNSLRAYLFDLLKENTRFLPLLANNARQFKPPMRLLGKFIKGSGSSEEAGKLNLKEAMIPFVEFGRLYALRHRMLQIHTMERIDALVWKGGLDSPSAAAMNEAYDQLMRLRLKAQLKMIDKDREAENLIVLNSMDHLDKVMLNQAFEQIEIIQRKIVYDFLGSGSFLGGSTGE